MAKKVSIQGYEGSFHQIAAQEYLGNDIDVIPCDTFREVVKIASDPKQSDGGFMAIENSIAGSILPNYTLLQKSKLKISGEIYLQIHQNLMTNPGISMEDVREVLVRLERAKRKSRDVDENTPSPLRIGIADGLSQPRLTRCLANPSRK